MLFVLLMRQLMCWHQEEMMVCVRFGTEELCERMIPDLLGSLLDMLMESPMLTPEEMEGTS